MSAGSGRPARRQPSYRRSQPRSLRQWGWHCLCPEWAQRVVDASAADAGDLVLDIGAGTGALTGPLVAVGVRVVAVEINPHRATILGQRFGDAITVVRADLRDLRLPHRPFRVVASPPYSVSTDVLRLLLSTDQLLSADLVLQRAAVRRLVLAPPSRRHTRQYTFELGLPVPRRAFRPPPQVDSVVLRVRRR